MNVIDLIAKETPAAPDAEQWIVGACILRPAILDELPLDAADFFDEGLGRMFGWLRERRDCGEPIDLGLLGRQFCGAHWQARIAEITTSLPSVRNVSHYAEMVQKSSKLRRLVIVGDELVNGCHHRNAEPEALLEAAETALAEVRLSKADGAPVTLCSAAVDASRRIDELLQDKGTGIPTGFPGFDHDQGGLFPGELTILAARPGCGKTSLALQIAMHNATKGRLVYFASLEMSAVELSLRLACSSAGVPSNSVRAGSLNQREVSQLNAALTEQGTAALELHDRPSLSVAAIRREIRRRVKRGLVLAVIDYLQLVQPDDRKLPREQQVARIVRSLKETAREYSVPILCLCQLNRQADGNEAPQLSHLRESGAIEQDADVVMFLAQRTPTDAKPHNTTLQVAKNRNGPTGPYGLHWDAARTRFRGLDGSDCANYDSALAL